MVVQMVEKKDEKKVGWMVVETVEWRVVKMVLMMAVK
jgi:hypothetical protein